MQRLRPLKGANLSAAFNRRGLAYDSQGDLDHAIADYSEAIRLNRKFAIAFADRGGAYKPQADDARSPLPTPLS